MQGANQNAASASGGSVGGERLGSGSEVVSPGSSTLHSHGGGSELREITDKHRNSPHYTSHGMLVECPHCML